MIETGLEKARFYCARLEAIPTENVLHGKIISEAPATGGMTVTVEMFVSDVQTYLKWKPDTVLCEILDGRTISASQRKKIYALLREVAGWRSEDIRIVKRQMQGEFLPDLSGTVEKRKKADKRKAVSPRLSA